MPVSTGAVRTVSSAEAAALLAGGSIRLLDVRSSEEHQRLGHIPGSLLLPVDLIACGAATLPRDGAPLLVYCEHGVRSAFAARFLARAGFPEVLNLAGGMSAWPGPREHPAGDSFGALGPSSWLLANADLLPRGGEVLDVACGRGRHALLLSSAGYRVRAVDRDAAKVEALAADALRLELPIVAQVLDLESAPPEFGEGAYDLVVVTNYLHRPLFPALTRALRRGGLLLYETFTVDQARRGHPTDPTFLLEHGELARLVAPLEVLRQRDGEFDGRFVAGVAARRG